MKKISVFLISIVFLLAACSGGKMHKDTQLLMGTFVEVISPDGRSAKIVFDEFKRVEDLISKYKETSEVSSLNKNGKIVASEEFFYIIKRSKSFYKASNGAFDITVGPLMNAWGFTDKNYRLPRKQELKKIKPLIGSDKIILDESLKTIEFQEPGMKIDLGGIGKGYAIDCAVNKLKLNGVDSCLINAGGQVYCLGNKFGNPWKVAVKQPRSNGLTHKIELVDSGASTSGDYQQFFVSSGKRFSHIMDPRTLEPECSGVVSVTVIGKEATVCDALSTSILVLGKDKGQVLADKFPDYKVIIIEEVNGKNHK